MIVSVIINVALMLMVVYLLRRKHRDETISKANSVVFSQSTTPIWKAAADDWANNPNDERTFEVFLIQTIEIMQKGQNQ